MRWSVVIPAYMPGENLAITLASVATAMHGRADYEVVVVDDASPSPIEISDYGAHVRVARQADNVGAVPNFNRAIGLAQGEFIHVLHADDYVEPDFYAAMERGLMTDGVVAAVSGVHRVDGEGNPILTMKPEMAKAGIWQHAFERLAVTNRVPAVSIVAKRSAYDRVGTFDESLVHAADWDMWIRLSQAGDIFYDPVPLASYRVHEAQHTATVTQSGKNIDEAIDVIKRLSGRTTPPEARRLMIRAFFYRAIYAARSAARAAGGGQASTALTQCKAGLRCVLLGTKAALRR